MVISLSLSPPRQQKKSYNNKTQTSGNSIYSMQGLNYFTPRPEDLMLQRINHIKTQSRSKDSLSSSTKKKFTSVRKSSNSGSKGKSPKTLNTMVKKKLTMKKNNTLQSSQQYQMSKPIYTKENLNIIIPNTTTNVLTNSQGHITNNLTQGYSVPQSQLHQSQMNHNNNSNAFQNFAKAAIQGSSSTKNSNASHFFHPLIENTGGTRKVQQVSKQGSGKQSRNPSAKPSKNNNNPANQIPNNQIMMLMDLQNTNRNLSNSQGRDASLSSGRKIRLQQAYESSPLSKDSRENKLIIRNGQDNIQKIILQNLQGMKQQPHFTNLQSVDLSDRSPTQNYQTNPNKQSEYLQQQRIHPLTSTNAQLQANGKKMMQPMQMSIRGGSRHSQKRRGSKGIIGSDSALNVGDSVDSNTNLLHFKSYQHEPLQHSEVLNSLATVSQRDFYKAAEILQQHAFQNKQNSKSTKKKKQNYTMATSSIASGGSIEPLMSSSYRHQLKIKPPKHSFNNQLKSNTNLQSPAKQTTLNMKMAHQQQQLISPQTSQQQQQQNQFLSNFTSKHSYNPQNYFQSAKLLNKQKQSQQNMQKSRNSSNSNLLLTGGHASATSPVIQNWHTQFGVNSNSNALATDIMIGCQSAKNLNFNTNSQVQSKNKTQNQINVPQYSNQNAQNYDPSNLLKTASDNSNLAHSQQIQAAIIKKIQNNFQLSFTNSFNQNHTNTTSNNLAGQLQQQQQSLTQKISPVKGMKSGSIDEELRFREYNLSQIQMQQYQQENEKKQKDLADNLKLIEQKLVDNLSDIQNSILDNNNSNSQLETTRKKTDAYLKVFDELITKESPMHSILLKLKKGFKDCAKDLENQNEKAKHMLKECEFQVREKSVDLRKLEQDLRDVERNETECISQIQGMTQQIDERDDQLERLEMELDNQRRKYKELFKQQMKTPYGKSAQKQMMIQNEDESLDIHALYEQLQEALTENSEVKQIAKEMQEELDYGKQRENKLMFFLFILKEKGFPISEVFEDEIKDIPTTRFSTHFDDEYKLMYHSIKQERKQAKRERKLELSNGGFGIQRDEVLAMSPLTERVFTYVKRREMRQSVIDRVAKNLGNASSSSQFGRLSQSEIKQKGITASKIDFDQVSYLADSNLSDSNFVPVTVQKASIQKRPAIVPKLDLISMPHQYESDSSSDSDDETEGKPKRGPNPRQLKKIFDKYNIITCARNIMLQEKEIKKRRRLQLAGKLEKFERSFTSSSKKSSMVIMEQKSSKKQQ